MKNAAAICSVSRQLVKVCEQIDTLTMGIQDTEQRIGGIADTLIDIRMDELEHAQMLTLKLTELITQAGEGDATNSNGADGTEFGHESLDSKNKSEGDGVEEGTDTT